VGRVDPAHQVEQRRLARAAAAGDGHDLPGAHLGLGVRQHLVHAGPLAEGAAQVDDAQHETGLGVCGAWIVETTRRWHCSGTMAESEWRLLSTFPDLPSAQALAEVLRAEGIAVQVMSDAGVLGQAAPSRLLVSAADLRRAQLSLSS